MLWETFQECPTKPKITVSLQGHLSFEDTGYGLLNRLG